MQPTNSVRKRSLLQNHVPAEQTDAPAAQRPRTKKEVPHLANGAPVVSRAKVTLPKPFTKGNAPTLS